MALVAGNGHGHLEGGECYSKQKGEGVQWGGSRGNTRVREGQEKRVVQMQRERRE